MIELAIIFFIWVCILALITSVGAGLCSLSWFPSRLVMGGHCPQGARLIARQLADALERGKDVAQAICPLHLNAADQARLRRFRRACARGERLQDAIITARLLPPAQCQLIAHVDQPELMIRLLHRYAQSALNLPSLAPSLALLHWIAPITAGILAWMSVVILPKFEQIFYELDLPLPLVTERVLALGRILDEPLGFLLLLLYPICCCFLPKALVWWWHGWQPLGRHLHRGFLLLDGMALGLPEAQLGRLLGYSGPHKNLAGLCQSIGFPVSQARDLALALNRSEARLQQLQAWGGAAATLLMWGFLVSLIAVVIYALFLPLVLTISTVAEFSP